MQRAVKFSSLALLCVLWLPPAAPAQVSTADVTGRVLDQSGAVIPGATVTVKSLASGLERACVSTSNGDYAVALLPPGDYETKVERQGFATVIQKFSLGIGQRQTLNFTLRLTLNLGVRYDADISFLPKLITGNPDTSNRVALIMEQALQANPTAPAAQQGIARIQDLWGDSDKLTRTTANWKEFQPRVGFAWDPLGTGKHVIRGGYGLAFDQVFQNLTLFTLQLDNPTIYTTIFSLSGTSLAGYRFGVDPLPAPLAASGNLPVGAMVCVNDPHLTDPYAHQTSIGWSWEFMPDWAFSVDYYHVLGIHEQRTLNVNPRILSLCDDPGIWPGADPGDPRCVAGANTRYLDAAFAADGLGANRIGEIRLISSNNRSRYDGTNFVLRKRFSQGFTMQAQYTLAWSRSWGGAPTASHGGTGIRVTPEQQFAQGEFGPTIFDERHRFVLSGVFSLPYGFEVAPIFQAASARPYPILAGLDINGDGITNDNDSACAGSTFTNRNIPVTGPFGCSMVEANSLRADRFSQMDVRFGKLFRTGGDRAQLRLYWEIYNLFDTGNFGNNVQRNGQLASFGQPRAISADRDSVPPPAGRSAPSPACENGAKNGAVSPESKIRRYDPFRFWILETRPGFFFGGSGAGRDLIAQQ